MAFFADIHRSNSSIKGFALGSVASFGFTPLLDGWIPIPAYTITGKNAEMEAWY